ncbi:O-antigen ligase family protein [Pengzhenrongella frigida]|uniref:O-antigen ligase domain-containing protein n=1 Tax=Pengzhenrongella frigida TaxID=1259133 RepID=A0A4Q5N0L9_9MICO|nr:O-antigen ligase family protein [Cellulomonas sp. HLT2-17]RYV50763.1 O-antigen ligase domain-containing protein [Cellulomonas sp. HLT2-17]
MNRLSVIRLAVTGLIAAGLLAYGLAAPVHPTYALGAAVIVLALAFTTYQPAAVPLLAMPLIVIIQRVGGESVNLSISDFALFGAFWFALVLGSRPYSNAMRTMLWLSFTYQAATLFTVIANPYRANTVEWFHAWMLVGGALVVGWAVGSSGRARLGMTLLILPCLVIAILTCVDAATQLAVGETGGVYLDWPFAMHKNYIGGVLGFAAVTLFARPPWLGWHPAFSYPSFVLCLLGVIASQARQALVGVAIALLVVALRNTRDRRRAVPILLAVVPALWFALASVRDQLTSGSEFNSANQRLTWYTQALEVWERNEWFGVGLRWWTTGRTEYGFQPPNAELEVLSSAGAVGLLGFLILMIGALVVLWRVDPRYGTLAFAILTLRLVQGQLDLFWVAVQVSVPFLVVGVCLGAQAFDSARAQAAEAVGTRGLVPVPARRPRRTDATFDPAVATRADALADTAPGATS